MKLLATLLLASASAGYALDFHSSVIQERGEGGTYSYLQFSDRENVVTYTPPKSWNCIDGSETLRLHPPGISQAIIDLQVRRLPTPLRVQDSDHSAFEQLARQALPNGAQNIQLLSSDAGPEVDGRPTLEFILSYSSFGAPYQASFLYLTRGTELLRFHVSSKPEDFRSLRSAFHVSLHTFAGFAEQTNLQRP